MKNIQNKKPTTLDEWIVYLNKKAKKEVHIDDKFRKWALKQLERM